MNNKGLKSTKPSKMKIGNVYLVYYATSGIWKPYAIMKVHDFDAYNDMIGETIQCLNVDDEVGNLVPGSAWNGGDYFFERNRRFYDLECTVEEFSAKYPEYFL